MGCHSENGNFCIPRMEFRIPRDCSENIPELSESSENGLFTPRAFFPEIGVGPQASENWAPFGDDEVELLTMSKRFPKDAPKSCLVSRTRRLGKSKRGLTNGGLSPRFSEKIGQKSFREKSGLFGPDWSLFRGPSGPFRG